MDKKLDLKKLYNAENQNVIKRIYNLAVGYAEEHFTYEALSAKIYKDRKIIVTDINVGDYINIELNGDVHTINSNGSCCSEVLSQRKIQEELKPYYIDNKNEYGNDNENKDFLIDFRKKIDESFEKYEIKFDEKFRDSMEIIIKSYGKVCLNDQCTKCGFQKELDSCTRLFEYLKKENNKLSYQQIVMLFALRYIEILDNNKISIKINKDQFNEINEQLDELEKVEKELNLLKKSYEIQENHTLANKIDSLSTIVNEAKISIYCILNG
jgi:hypothetical protein